jgi:hypothetical protein
MVVSETVKIQTLSNCKQLSPFNDIILNFISKLAQKIIERINRAASLQKLSQIQIENLDNFKFDGLFQLLHKNQHCLLELPILFVPNRFVTSIQNVVAFGQNSV